MINILSIRCSLAFAPYLLKSFNEFSSGGAVAPRVVRQAGKGLILRTDDNLILRHEHRQSSLDRIDARHYLATVQFRSDFYDVLRMQDEVILSVVGEELLLSHPQSELWLNAATVAALLDEFTSDVNQTADAVRRHAPEWL